MEFSFFALLFLGLGRPAGHLGWRRDAVAAMFEGVDVPVAAGADAVVSAYARARAPRSRPASVSARLRVCVRARVRPRVVPVFTPTCLRPRFAPVRCSHIDPPFFRAPPWHQGFYSVRFGPANLSFSVRSVHRGDTLVRSVRSVVGAPVLGPGRAGVVGLFGRAGRPARSPP